MIEYEYNQYMEAIIMFYVMSNKTDIIVVEGGNVRHHQRIGFGVESRHGSCEAAEQAAEQLEKK